eukprot:42504-Chlamydomonas_euryale.AAC.1
MGRYAEQLSRSPPGFGRLTTTPSMKPVGTWPVCPIAVKRRASRLNIPSPPARHSRNCTAFGPGVRPPPQPESLAASANFATLTSDAPAAAPAAAFILRPCPTAARTNACAASLVDCWAETVA